MQKELMGRRSAIRRAIRRFEKAVENYSEIGTIPIVCADADEAHHSAVARELLSQEYRRSRELLENLFMRYSA